MQKEKSSLKRCIGADCGYFVTEKDYDECCGCEAKRKGVSFAIVRQERNDQLRSQMQSATSGGW